jgi:hypothetical protein
MSYNTNQKIKKVSKIDFLENAFFGWSENKFLRGESTQYFWLNFKLLMSAKQSAQRCAQVESSRRGFAKLS